MPSKPDRQIYMLLPDGVNKLPEFRAKLPSELGWHTKALQHCSLGRYTKALQHCSLGRYTEALQHSYPIRCSMMGSFTKVIVITPTTNTSTQLQG